MSYQTLSNVYAYKKCIKNPLFFKKIKPPSKNLQTLFKKLFSNTKIRLKTNYTC